MSKSDPTFTTQHHNIGNYSGPYKLLAFQVVAAAGLVEAVGLGKTSKPDVSQAHVRHLLQFFGIHPSCWVYMYIDIYVSLLFGICPFYFVCVPVVWYIPSLFGMYASHLVYIPTIGYVSLSFGIYPHYLLCIPVIWYIPSLFKMPCRS